MNAELPKIALAERLAERIAAVEAAGLTAAMRARCEETAIDVIGLCLAARNEAYVRSTLEACDDGGPCTAIGHSRTLGGAGAALVNGTAAHGEDFDDTFEGGPVHAGAVIVPAVLAAAERYGSSGADALAGVAVGIEIMCRMGLVAPKMVHKAGFHPTAVFGAMGAAAAVARTLRLNMKQTVDAFGVAGSMASGIIEYLAEGASTKRMHAGWAAQSGYRAALMARAGFEGPRTVFEGSHGFFHGFANTTRGDFEALAGDFGARWIAEALAFKLYPCGTMTHPYIDCARRLGVKLKANDVVEMVCDVGEGTVHRLWEPLAAKQKPANGYAGKFSTPYCIAAGFVRGNVGLSDFTDDAVKDVAVLALAGKVRFRIDPDNPYPNNFTGHIRATLRDGSVVEERQPHMRGGAHEPLSRADIEQKFMLNARHGGYDGTGAKVALTIAAGVFAGKIDLSGLRG
ncbi:MAG: MmgE/PrpD family protein [Alphaproteobacteria bacterium]|nr:MmgE/PrpD family protein [Alphaproteobacteria bacterium]